MVNHIFSDQVMITEENEEKLNNSFSEKLTDSLKENVLKLRNPKKKHPDKEKQINQALKEIKENKNSAIKNIDAIKKKYKKKEPKTKKEAKKNDNKPLFEGNRKKDHTIIHNRNASASAIGNRANDAKNIDYYLNKKKNKSPVKQKEKNDKRERKAASVQKRKKYETKLNDADKNIIRNLNFVSKKTDNIKKDKEKEKDKKKNEKICETSVKKRNKKHVLSNSMVDINVKKNLKTPAKNTDNNKKIINNNNSSVRLHNKTLEITDTKNSARKKNIHVNNRNEDLHNNKNLNENNDNKIKNNNSTHKIHKKNIRISFKPICGADDSTNINEKNNTISDLNKYNNKSIRIIKPRINDSLNVTFKNKNSSIIKTNPKKNVNTDKNKNTIDVNTSAIKKPKKKNLHHKSKSMHEINENEYLKNKKHLNCSTNILQTSNDPNEPSKTDRNKYAAIIKTDREEYKVKKEIKPLNENLSTNDILRANNKYQLSTATSFCDINKNKKNYGPIDIKNLFVADSLKKMLEKLFIVLRRNKVKFWKISPIKYYCKKNGENFNIEILTLSEKLKIAKDSIKKEENETNEKKILFYISVLSKESNTTQANGIIKSIVKMMKKNELVKKNNE